MADFARILIADAEGLHGQIILNGNASTDSVTTLVKGVVALGDFAVPDVQFSTVSTSSTPRTATTGHLLPHYSALPGDDLRTSGMETGFGGGAVGVVPFAVHTQSSDSYQRRRNLNHSNTHFNDELLTTEWNSRYYSTPPCIDQPAVLDFYGPVTFAPPLNNHTPPNVAVVTLQSVPYNATPYIEFSVHPAVTSGAGRLLYLQPYPGDYLPYGEYEVAALDDSAGLKCDGLMSAVVAAVVDAAFTVALDCPGGTAECTYDTSSFDCQSDEIGDCSCEFLDLCDDIDFNNDSLFPDTADIDDLLSVFSGGPCSSDPTPGCNDIDFNNDGLFPDTLDIDAFLSKFSGGPCLLG